MTFSYWWLNMVQRSQALSAKKWYVRDNPKSTGYTVDDLRGMSVKALAKKMVGYTANIPGTRASKAQLRKLILTMVKQIEIETASCNKGRSDEAAGDIPSLFGTLTSQRYHWDDVIRIIAMVEGIEDYKSLSKSKRRELVNKYPLFVAWYGALRLELVLKTVVVPLYGAQAYVAVYEWSPTGGMVHLHYILWKTGAPRFDLHAEGLMSRVAALRKAGLVAGGEVTCDVKYVVDFFADYITEWNPNKNPDGEEKVSHVAERVNEAAPHTASLTTAEMLDLLRGDNPHERFAYYERAVRTEHLHDFHYPDPLGPPNPSQPCAQLLKGTLNMWYCGNGYPRDLVCQPCEMSVSQDALRPDLWRVNLCRNCQVMNPHLPMATVGCQSNTDGTPVATRHQAEMYVCKYCSKYCKGKGQGNVLYEVLDDMERRNAIAQDRLGGDFEESKLGSKLHRAFMAEVGVEMCQAEVAHHANRCPEYLVSRQVKYVHLYKKALALNTKKDKKAEHEDGWQDEDYWTEDWTDEGGKLGTKPSDVELYERRCQYYFWPEDTPISQLLPPKDTPEEQVAAAHSWDFFRLVCFRGGRNPYFQWHKSASIPIVVMSPVVKLTEGPDFAFAARWALMQYHPWTDRRQFLDMSDAEVKDYFRRWRSSPECPWYIAEQYLAENGRRARGGAGPVGKGSKATGHAVALEPEDYEARIAAMLDARDFAGAAALQYQQQLALGDDGATAAREVASDHEDAGEGSETEQSSSAEGSQDEVAVADTRVLKMLYKGNMEEISRQEEQSRKAKVCNRKHNFYRNTRCTSVAQEEQSALPAGVININEDSDDDEAYLGDQKEIAKEMEELRVAQHWVNQEGWDAASEGRAVSNTTGATIDLLLDWGDVKRKLAEGAGGDVESGVACVDEASVLNDYSLDRLDPTQRAFVERVLAWAADVATAYEDVRATGQFRPVPLLRSYLGGSAGSGKSTTLRTCVQHVRLMFMKRGIPAKVELTAYTGVAAFNIGFGARTACSAFQVFPKAAWRSELDGKALRMLEDTWGDVVLLIIDEVSFIGRALLARMHFRTQQAKRAYFSEAGLDPNEYTFGDLSIVLVGDFGQLDPIDDWSMCDTEATYATCPKRLRNLWKHSCHGKLLLSTFKEAMMLKRIHRSKEDLWWTESCLRLRDFTCTKEGDYDWWRQHDLDRGHFNDEQREYFETHALWLCARNEDVGARNGRKLAHMAEDGKNLIHQIHAQHSSKSAKKLSSVAFDGLRSVVNLVRDCKMVLTRNVAYKFGLANGTRGRFIGVVYGTGGVGTFPEALIGEFPDYCGPAFYPDEPKWVPLLPLTAVKDGTRMTRTQFPVVAGFALTVNKAQGLTVKEGVVIYLVGGKRFRPASKHGLPFVAFTRSESFAMTAFKNIPPWQDFVKGRDSDMLRMRLAFTDKLEKMHVQTLARHSDMKTTEQEQRAHERWLAAQSTSAKRHKKEGPRMPCPCCTP